MTQDRRTFLASIGAAALGIATGCRTRLAEQPVSRKLQRIGLQLYTVRSEMTRDVAATLRRVAQIGYKEVEYAGYFNKTPREHRALLDQYGLTAPSTHLAITAIEKEPQKTFDDAKTVGHQWLTVPSLPTQPATVDDWKRVAERFNTVAAQVKRAGFRYAYHNHNMEFRKVGDAVPYDILLEHTDPALVSFEMDVYWVTNAGADPLAYLARYPGRFKMLHLKDSMGAPDHKMVDVGSGTIDFKAILARANGIEHYFVEHDEPADPFASIAASYR